jgi:HSP20 family protein
MAEKTEIAVKPRETALSRRDPFEMLDALHEELSRLWGRGWPLTWPTRRLAPGTSEWAPRVDVFEKNGNLIVKAELPGIRKEDVQVTLDQGDLEIKGERKSESEVKEDNYYRSERSYGSFYRRMALPFEVKPEQIKATLKDGVLEVSMPRPPESKPEPRKISVS